MISGGGALQGGLDPLHDLSGGTVAGLASEDIAVGIDHHGVGEARSAVGLERSQFSVVGLPAAEDLHGVRLTLEQGEKLWQ